MPGQPTECSAIKHDVHYPGMREADRLRGWRRCIVFPFFREDEAHEVGRRWVSVPDAGSGKDTALISLVWGGRHVRVRSGGANRRGAASRML